MLKYRSRIGTVTDQVMPHSISVKSWAYTGALLLILVAVVVLATRGVVFGVHGEGDVTLTSAETAYLNDETVMLHATLDFSDEMLATITNVQLVVNGPQSLNASLPLEEGEHDLTGNEGVTGTLIASVDFNLIDSIDDGIDDIFKGVFKGAGQSANIQIDVEWIPAVSPDPIGDYVARLNIEFDDSPTNSSDDVPFTIIAGVTISPVVATPALSALIFEVDIVADDVTGLAGAEFTLSYDDSLLFVSAQVDQAFVDSGSCGGEFNAEVAGVINLAVGCSQGRTGSQLVLWTVKFTAPVVSADTPTNDLQVTNVFLGDDSASPAEILARGDSAAIVVAPAICGDLTGDMVVNILDVITSLKIVVALVTPTPTQLALGDLDQDGAITIADSATTLSHIVGTIPTLDICGPQG